MQWSAFANAALSAGIGSVDDAMSVGISTPTTDKIIRGSIGAGLAGVDGSCNLLFVCISRFPEISGNFRNKEGPFCAVLEITTLSISIE